MYNSASNGSSTLCLYDGGTSNVTIVDSFFIANSLQNEKFSYGWAMARISSNYLSLFLVRTLISGNYAERWVDKDTSERKPFLLFLSSQTEAEISINGLQYENNKASGI